MTTLAVINLMPQAEVYLEYMENVLPPGVDVKWIRVRNHAYNSSNQDILSSTHNYYEDTNMDECDAILLTGSAMDMNPVFTEAHYWNEVVETLTDADKKVGSVAGVCWGAQVVAKTFYGIEKRHFDNKLSGVYDMTNLSPDHELMRCLDDRYWLPQSRYAEMEPQALDENIKNGNLIPLDWSQESGYTTIVSANGEHLMLQGHQDYPTKRLAQEYYNAQKKGRNPPVPINYDPENPVNRWRANNRALFDAWLKMASGIKAKEKSPLSFDKDT